MKKNLETRRRTALARRIKELARWIRMTFGVDTISKQQAELQKLKIARAERDIENLKKKLA